MAHLPRSATDEDLVRFVDRWAALMEAEDYAAAYAFTAQDPYMQWTPELMREVIKQYDECRADQRVTVEGKPTDVEQRRDVTRWETNRLGSIGEVWYDLNIDGFVSDMTATFAVLDGPDGLTIRLNDIHVM